MVRVGQAGNEWEKVTHGGSVVSCSCNSWNANNARNVTAAGSNDNNNAINGNYVAPDSIFVSVICSN